MIEFEILRAPITQGDTTRRARETAAVASLVAERFGAGATILHRSNGAPYLPMYQGYISISHCVDEAVVAISDRPIGVDIETWREQLIKVSPKFLSDEESSYVSDDKATLLWAWTVKEAIYKLISRDGLNFRNDIRLPIDLSDTALAIVDGQSIAIKIIDVERSPERCVTVAMLRDERKSPLSPT